MKNLIASAPRRNAETCPTWCEKGSCNAAAKHPDDRKHYGPELRIPLGTRAEFSVDPRVLAMAQAVGDHVVAARVFYDEPAFIAIWTEQAPGDAQPSVRVSYGETDMSAVLAPDARAGIARLLATA